MQTGMQDIRLPVTAICPACGHENDLAATRHGQSIFTYVCGKEGDSKFRKGSCRQEFDVLGTMPDLPAAKLTSRRFEVGRSFCTKLWNSARFALMNLDSVSTDARRPEDLALEDRWILDGLNQCIRAVDQGLRDYNPSAALTAAREFFWGSLCDWYLELIKPRLQDPDDASAPVARQVLAHCLDQVLRLLHPFVPFISEHLWQRLGQQVPARGLGVLSALQTPACLIEAPWPVPAGALDAPELRQTFADLQAITRTVREVRANRGLPPRKPLSLTLKPPADRAAALLQQVHVVQHLAGVERLNLDPAAERRPGDVAKVVGDLQLFVHAVIDDAEERKRLQQELERVDREIATCDRKLQNPNFVQRAPAEVVAEQRERLASYQASREAILENLELLG
jgi:valyl-tRNA synthetase